MMSVDAPLTAKRLRRGVSLGGRSFQVMSEWLNGADSAAAASAVAPCGGGGLTFRAAGGGKVESGDVKAKDNDAASSQWNDTQSTRYTANVVFGAIAAFPLLILV